MMEAMIGQWGLGGLLVIFTSMAFFTRQLRLTASYLGLVGVGLSILYYIYFLAFWPLLYFLIYLLVFFAFLLMALTFPAAAMRDDVFTNLVGPQGPAPRGWPQFIKWPCGILLGMAAAWALLNLIRALGALPSVEFSPLKAEEYFIDLAVLSIFLLLNVIGLIFIFATTSSQQGN